MKSGPWRGRKAARRTSDRLKLHVAEHPRQRTAGQGQAPNRLVGHVGRSACSSAAAAFSSGQVAPAASSVAAESSSAAAPAAPAASSVAADSSSAEALQDAMNVATKAREDAGRPSLDIACGDINMARRKQEIQSSGTTPLTTSTKAAASFQFLIGEENVALWVFVRRGSNSFLQQCGAKHTSAGLSV